MAIEPAEVQKWAKVRFAKTETPLLKLVEDVKTRPNMYQITRAYSFPVNYVLSKTNARTGIVATHAFVVKSATPIDTGNFVPPGQPLPEGVHKDHRKDAPQWGAQITVTFDMTVDPEFHKLLQTLEDWAEKDQTIQSEDRPRMSWMKPAYVADRSIYIATSPLFQDRSVFNSKEDGPTAKYPLHEWIKKVVVPNSEKWAPNPARATFFERVDGKQVSLEKTDLPRLLAGDLVKMNFMVGFTLTKTSWTMVLSPIQFIRLYRTDLPESAIRELAQDTSKLGLKQEGEGLDALSDSDDEEPITISKDKGKGKARATLSEDSDAERDVHSPDWDPLTPLLEGQTLPGDSLLLSGSAQSSTAADDDGRPASKPVQGRGIKRDRENEDADEPERKKRTVKSRAAK